MLDLYTLCPQDTNSIPLSVHDTRVIIFQDTSLLQIKGNIKSIVKETSSNLIIICKCCRRNGYSSGICLLRKSSYIASSSILESKKRYASNAT